MVALCEVSASGCGRVVFLSVGCKLSLIVLVNVEVNDSEGREDIAELGK